MAKDKKKGKTRVRKPVEDSSPPEPVEDEKPPKPVAKKSPVSAPKAAPPKTSGVPRARVILEGAASLRRQGRVFVKDRPFMVDGEEAIAFFESDKRFHVSRV
jgi:hypothetical protein